MLQCMIKICDSACACVTEIVASGVSDAVDWPGIAFDELQNPISQEDPMKKILLLSLAGLFACGVAYAADDKTAPAANTQQTKMTTCQKEAGDKKLEGKARQDYVNNCLKAKPAGAEKPKNKLAMCNEKTKGMKKEEADKARSECMKAP